VRRWALTSLRATLVPASAAVYSGKTSKADWGR
jgi:hypothetical protein